MYNISIPDLLKYGWYDSSLKRRIYFPIKDIWIGQDLFLEVKRNFCKQETIVICDENTLHIAEKLKHRNIFCFKDHLEPNVENVELLKGISRSYQRIIGVGSGVLCDICKCVSSDLQIELVIFATALSMNGYCSANSSIVSKEGLYGSIASKMPDYLIFDLEVLVEAPPRLLKAGIGDLLCYSSVLSDWLYSHIFFDSYFSVNIFKFIIDLQYMLISNISPGEWSSYELIQLVCKSIILSGLSMYIAGGSYPSSQGEHAIAHNYHLLNIDKTIHNLHGEEISVTSLIMMKIQQDLLKRDFLEILDASIANSIIDFRFAHMRKNQRNRLILYNNLIKSEKNIKKCWKIIGNVVDSATLTYDQLYQLYRSNGVKSSYSQLSWEKETLLQSVRQAAFLRERIGFLDLIGFYNQEQLLSFL